MTDARPPSDPEKAPPGIDITVPHPARVYDYILGGTNHFAVDRELAERMAATTGGLDELRSYARTNRAFLGRAVRYLVDEAGIRQFLDIGTGIPSSDNVHGVAQQAAPDARIVYVDNDPLVLAHADTLLESTSEGATAYIIGDLLRPKSILLRAAVTLDFDEPVAIMLISILHLIGDEDEPYEIVARLLEAVPPGSYLVISHMATDLEADKMAEFAKIPDHVKQPLPFSFAMRPLPDVTRFLDGLDLVEPGVVMADLWRPDPETPVTSATPIYGAVGRKP